MHATRLIIFLNTWLLLVAIGVGRLWGQLPVAVPVDGQPFSAQLQSISSDWKIHFRQPMGDRVIAASDLIRWGKPQAPRLRTHIVLADGGLLIAQVVQLTGNHLVVGSDLWQETLLPLESVRGVLLTPSSDLQQRDRWLEKIQRRTGKQDTLYLQNRDTIQGVLTGLTGLSQQRLEPTFEIRPGQRSSPLAIPVKNVIAVGFNASLVRKPMMHKVQAGIGFRDGSWLHVEKITVGDRGLECELAGSIRIKTHAMAALPATEGSAVSQWQQVTMIRPRSNRVVYLGDLQPIDYKHLPFLNVQWPFRIDRNVLGGQLRVAGRLYRKGIGMHSTSRLAYDVPEGCDRFQAEVGIDDQAQQRGSVVFSVYLQQLSAEEGESSWKRVTSSAVKRGGQAAQPLDVPLMGAKRLALVVECSDQGDERDLANWLSARFLRSLP